MRQTTKPKMSRREGKKESAVWEEDCNDGDEEDFFCAEQQETALETKTSSSRASSVDLETRPKNNNDNNNSITGSSSTSTSTSTSTNFTAEERQKWKAKADRAAKHSAKMREVWAKRRAEGTN